MDRKNRNLTKKVAMAGVLTALAVVGSMLSFPVAGSKCAPVQHMVNILAAVLLGPAWSVGICFCGDEKSEADLCGRGLWYGCPGRSGGLAGGQIPDGSGTGRPVRLYHSVPDFHGGGKYPGLYPDHGIGKGRCGK